MTSSGRAEKDVRPRFLGQTVWSLIQRTPTTNVRNPARISRCLCPSWTPIRATLQLSFCVPLRLIALSSDAPRTLLSAATMLELKALLLIFLVCVRESVSIPAQTPFEVSPEIHAASTSPPLSQGRVPDACRSSDCGPHAHSSRTAAQAPGAVSAHHRHPSGSPLSRRFVGEEGVPPGKAQGGEESRWLLRPAVQVRVQRVAMEAPANIPGCPTRRALG